MVGRQVRILADAGRDTGRQEVILGIKSKVIVGIQVGILGTGGDTGGYR